MRDAHRNPRRDAPRGAARHGAQTRRQGYGYRPRGASYGRAYGQGALDIAVDILRSIPPKGYAVACLVLALMVIVPGAMTANAARAAEEAAQVKAAQQKKAKKAKAATEQEQLDDAEFELTADALDEVPTADGLQPFSLAGLADPQVASKDLDAVESALAAVEKQGPASVVFVDVQTGRGLSYQPDLIVYGASSFKALCSLYVCEEFIETGEASLDTYCTVNYSLGPDGYLAGSSYTISSLIEGAITQSSNNAFGALRDTFDSQGFDRWVTALGADEAVCQEDSWFPSYCARSSAGLWAEMLAYLSSGTETAQWLGGLTGQTTVSFIRDGLEGTGATVRDKAGWCTDADPAYNSVSDAGIIEVDGKTYIMSILTGMPDSEDNRALVGDLAAALLACRDALDIQDGSAA